MDDRWSSWQAEYAGTHRLPTIWSVFLVLGLLAVLALGLFSAPTATAEGGERSQGSLCDQHAGRPGWSAVCEDTGRR